MRRSDDDLGAAILGQASREVLMRLPLIPEESGDAMDAQVIYLREVKQESTNKVNKAESEQSSHTPGLSHPRYVETIL